MVEARFYDEKNGICYCKLCPHYCVIEDGSFGKCRVRKNEGGTLLATSYGKLSSLAIDPIEKKPLYMFKDGVILSVGSYGCNFECGFCQNHNISMGVPKVQEIPPHILALLAEKHSHYGNLGVAYTYNEPFISYEYVYDTAVLVKEKGLDNVLVTNGFVNPEPLQEILPYIDAMNIDLKSYSSEFYKSIGGKLEPVKRTIETSMRRCHVEITTLIISGENDSPEEIENLAKYIAGIDKNLPLHLTRFRPSYKMTDKEPTTFNKTKELKSIANQYLTNVFA